MTKEDLLEMYEEMKSLFQKDKELTHIDISFHIQPVKSVKKIARISIKTFKENERRIN